MSDDRVIIFYFKKNQGVLILKKAIKYFIRDSARFFLGKKSYTVLRFIFTHKYLPSFSPPRSFSEKIIFRKFSEDSIFFSKFVDKYVVRGFVKEKLGDDYLIPLLKVKDHIHPSDFDDLPNKFVIKTSNGGGGENVLIVEDKESLDLYHVCNRFNSYLELTVGDAVDECFYDIEKPRIIFESLIKNDDGTYISDYKIHVFNSNNRSKVFIQVDSDRFSNHKRSIYNEDLTIAPFYIQPKYPTISVDFKFPDNINELIRLAKCLADDFKYVRVDMYSVDGEIFFGEMTFCHGSGWEPIEPKEFDFSLGHFWDEYNE